MGSAATDASVRTIATPGRLTDMARLLYDAECALHAAHQSQVAAWIAAADARLHEAVAEYLLASTALVKQ
ncbi:MAG TPA: hypothetical protein VGJ95_11840 [Pseudonocardiaceae bacterium]